MITNNSTPSNANHLKLRHVKQCVFPYNYFKTGEESVVRGIIGNDADIIGIYKKNTILPNNRVIVVVEYDSIDFDSFIIYKAVNPKSVHTGSNYIVVNDNTDIVNNIKNNVPVKLYKISTSELNSTLDYCYFTIRTLVEEKYKTEFNYYGTQLKTLKSVLHNYSSLFDFGPQLKMLDNDEYHRFTKNDVHDYNPVFSLDDIANKTYKELLGDLVDNYDLQTDLVAYQQLTLVVGRDPNSKNDIECYKKTLDKESYVKLTEKDIGENYKTFRTKAFNNITKACVVDFRDLTPKQLHEFLKTMRTGLVILHGKRCYTTLIYIPDYINRLDANSTINVIDRDLYNVIKLNEDVMKNKN